MSYDNVGCMFKLNDTVFFPVNYKNSQMFICFIFEWVVFVHWICMNLECYSLFLQRLVCKPTLCTNSWKITRHILMLRLLLMSNICFLFFCCSLCKGRTLYSVIRDAKVVLDVNKTRQIAQEMVKVSVIDVKSMWRLFVKCQLKLIHVCIAVILLNMSVEAFLSTCTCTVPSHKPHGITFRAARWIRIKLKLHNYHITKIVI